ncbi:MAG: cytochrome P450 [Solirubrobacterales bacterium]
MLATATASPTETTPSPQAAPPIHGLPPGPPLPRALQTMVWFRRAQEVLRRCHNRYGDTFTLRIAYEGTWVFVSHPDAIKQVFTGDPNLLHAGEANRILLPVVGPKSVLLLDRSEHLSQRKLLLPPFHGERMQRYGELMAEIAAEEIERWPLGEPYALRPRMQAVTLEIILRAVFGVREGERLERLRAALRNLLDLVTDPRQALFLIALGPERIARFGPFQRHVGRVDRLIAEEIHDRRDADDLADRVDILSLLLQARHEDGSPMSDGELRDELVTLLVAGHETTATALSWAVERLVRHPDKLERLTAEVRDGGEEYLTATIQETLRLRPVLSLVNRTLKAPMEIGGYELPAGIKVAPCIYLVHRNPEVYPQPDAFRPERFIERPPGTYTWIPFGGGTRRCLGAAFAQFEMQVVLRELVLRRTLRPSRPESEPVLRRAITETPRHDAEVLVG